MRIRLPLSTGTIDYDLNPAGPLHAVAGSPPTSRIVYASAHVVADPNIRTPTGRLALDMDSSLAFRRHLWSLGFRIAEAMDTAQRGMGLSWPSAKDLIRASCSEALILKSGIACGANTDQLPPGNPTLDDVAAAYEEQCAWIEESGGQVILMASRAMPKCAKSSDDYRHVYGRLLTQLSRPAILHWLGEAFDPELKGYWGGSDTSECMSVLLALIRDHAPKIDGVKISLLDKDREIEMRRRLPTSVRMYTGDDFNYPELIRGDELGHSDALLGVFDGIAPAAAAALRALDSGNLELYDELLAPTLPLSRHIFATPTFHYKTGLTFLAYLNGHQRHFRMLGGLETARSATHLAELFVLADRARLLSNPQLAVERMTSYLSAPGRAHA
jgi:Protein of unknown function (DUF993).